MLRQMNVHLYDQVAQRLYVHWHHCPEVETKQQRTSNLNSTPTIRDKQIFKQTLTRLSSTSNVALDDNISLSLEGNNQRHQCASTTMMNIGKDDKKETDSLLTEE